MKGITQFRNDLRAWQAREGISQVRLAKMSGVDQASISRFLREEDPEGLSGESVLRLYRFVYPLEPPTPPLSAESGEGERADGDEI